MNYHAHVYWQNEAERQAAVGLRETLGKIGCGLGRMMDQPIGPHPLPSYQVEYSTPIARQVEDILAASRLDVLLHEDTGDDLRDHTEGARWLGRVLKLDLAWLEQYTRNKQNAY